MLNQIQIKKTWQQFCVEALPFPGLCWGKSLSTFLKFCSGLTDQEHRVAVEKNHFFNRLTPQCHQCHSGRMRIPAIEWMHTTENNWKQSNASQANAMHPNVFRQFHNFNMTLCVQECTLVRSVGWDVLKIPDLCWGKKKSTLLRFFGGANRSRTEFTVAKQLRSFPLVVGVGDK